jgi:hypothetical protein
VAKYGINGGEFACEMLVNKMTLALSEILVPSQSLNGPANNLTQIAKEYGNADKKPVKVLWESTNIYDDLEEGIMNELRNNLTNSVQIFWAQCIENLIAECGTNI